MNSLQMFSTLRQLKRFALWYMRQNTTLVLIAYSNYIDNLCMLHQHELEQPEVTLFCLMSHLPLLCCPGTASSYTRSNTHPPLAGKSLWLLAEGNRFRVATYNLVINKYFDYFMFLMIILNCIAMAYEYPDLDNHSLEGIILHWA